MWEASRTVLNGDGSITVTKLTGMAVWVLNDNHKLFVFKRCMEQRHFYCRRGTKKKNIPRSLFLGTLIVVIYILANLAYLALLPMHTRCFRYRG
jgi:APA family basic amino acid/polyamine antiporter